MRKFILVIFVSFICLVNGLRNDPCTIAPCAFGQICIPKDTSYFCAEENAVRAIQNAMKHKMFVGQANSIGRVDNAIISTDSSKQNSEMTKNTINFLSSISSPLARIQQQNDGFVDNKQKVGSMRTSSQTEAMDKTKSGGNMRIAGTDKSKFGNMRTAVLANGVDSTRNFEDRVTSVVDKNKVRSKPFVQDMGIPQRVHAKFPSPSRVLTKEQQQEQQFLFANNKFPTVQRVHQNNFGLGVTVNEKLMNKGLQNDENQVEEDLDIETTTTATTRTTTTTTTTTSTPVYQEPFCKGHKFGDEIAHPNDVRKFIVCLHKGEYSIMSCPVKLKYNKYKGRCDHSEHKPTPACLSNPCKNNGTCLDTMDYDFLCDCPGGFSGETCEKGAGDCSKNPCGVNGLCYAISTIVKELSYYCLCDNGKTYGLDCQLNRYVNPCDADVTEAYFASKLGKNLFIHCENDIMNLRPCNPPLVWSQDLLTCTFA